MATSQSKYRRVILKLSGEALMGGQEFGIDQEVLKRYSEEIRSVHDLGVQVGIVIGGGNIFRGVSDSPSGIDK
ncbi:MAG: UMP kinase, partial [Bacteroidota bacterium]